METTLMTLWNNFKKLPWWKKILLFIPLILVGIGSIIFMIDKSETTNEDIVRENKKKTDKQIESFNKSLNKLEKERKVIKDKRKEIRKELEDAKADYNNVCELIDNTDADKLDSIAARLRADATRNRNRSRF